MCPHASFFSASAYSERYLGLPTPEDNFAGYEASSLIGGYGGERAKYIGRIFLAHGMADRNVHVQHSMLLAKELIRHGVPFQQQVFTQKCTFICAESEVNPISWLPLSAGGEFTQLT